MSDCKTASPQQSLLSALASSLDSQAQDEVIFGILCDVYLESLSSQRTSASASTISAEGLFTQFPALAHKPSLRGLTLWAELTSRVSFALTDPQFDSLNDAEHASVEHKLQAEELRSLTGRFPDEAAHLAEQLSVYCLVRDQGCRSDAALQNIDPRYTPLALLGSGWFGSVYLAWDEALDRDVAIKIPYPSTLDTDSSIFLNEARNAAQLQHENIARVIDFAQSESSCYIIYEYVRNAQDLDNYCQTHRPRVAARLELLKQICNGLAHAHRHKIVHRDLKPANILVSEGQVSLADFGLSTNQNKLYREFNARAGTLEYMSPEQKVGTAATDKSDIYSLGIIAQHVFADCAKPRRLKQLIRRCTRTTPRERPTADQCLAVIQKIQQTRARRRPMIAAALIGALTIGGVGGLTWRNQNAAIRASQHEFLVKLDQFQDASQNAFDSPRNLGLKSHAEQLRNELNRSKAEFQKQFESAFPALDFNAKSRASVVAVVDAVLLMTDGHQARALQLLESAGPLPDDQWRYEAAVARGRILQSLRRFPDAFRAFDQALQIKPTEDAVLRAALSALNSDDIDTAVSLQRNALKRLDQVDSEPHLVSYQARFNTQLSEAFRKSGQTTEAIEASQVAIALFAELSKKHDDYKLDWSLALYQLATLQLQATQYDQSVGSFQQCEDVLRKLVDRDEREAVKPHLAKALTGHSIAARLLHRLDEALKLANEAESIFAICIKESLASDVDRAATLLEIASCLSEAERYAESLVILKQAETIYRQSSTDHSLSAANLATTLCNQAHALSKLNPGKNEQIFSLATEAIQILEALAADGKLNAPRRRELSRAYQLRGLARGITKDSSIEERSLALKDVYRSKELVVDDMAGLMVYSETMLLLGGLQRTYDADAALFTYTEAIDKLQALTLPSIDENLVRLYIERIMCRRESSAIDFKLMLQDALASKRIADSLLKNGNPNAETYLQNLDIIIQALTPLVSSK